jgi:hypothetical protein
MTAAPTDLARKRPAEVVAQAEPQPRVINGHRVRRDNAGLISGVLLCLLLAFLFAGFLLSSL